MRKLLTLALVGLILGALAGCSGGGGESSEPPADPGKNKAFNAGNAESAPGAAEKE